MRLSLLIAFALLFGSVLASPTPMDPEDPSPPGGGQGKETETLPEQGGSQASPDESHLGFGPVKTQDIVSVLFLRIQAVLNA